MFSLDYRKQETLHKKRSHNLNALYIHIVKHPLQIFSPHFTYVFLHHAESWSAKKIDSQHRTTSRSRGVSQGGLRAEILAGPELARGRAIEDGVPLRPIDEGHPLEGGGRLGRERTGQGPAERYEEMI